MDDKTPDNGLSAESSHVLAALAEKHVLPPEVVADLEGAVLDIIALERRNLKEVLVDEGSLELLQRLLRLSTRAANILRDVYDIHTVRDFREKEFTRSDLLRSPNCGKATTEEILRIQKELRKMAA